MPTGTSFSVWPFRFHFVAVDALYFPPDKAANVLRGAFGVIFRKLACVSACPSVRACDIASDCPFARIFEPKQDLSLQAGPSGLSDWPRPFVFRALHLDGRRLEPGMDFHFDLVLFEPPEKALPYFVLAFRELGKSGLGPGRGRAALERVEDLGDGALLYEQQRFTTAIPLGIHLDLSTANCSSNGGASFSLRGASAPPLEGHVSAGRTTSALPHATRLLVRFETPTELKSDGAIVETLEFPILLSRLRDRVSNLRLCYQGGSLDVDFDGLGRAASEVRIARSSLRRVEVSRHSSRTGQTHSIGGVIGEVEYEGDLGAFIPWLQAGQWTGVGRQTVWGKGMIAVSEVGAACTA